MKTLTNPDDAALNAAFAEHVAGWVVLDTEGQRIFGYDPKEDIDGHHQTHFRDWAGSADQVLPFLVSAHIDYRIPALGGVTVIIFKQRTRHFANAPTLAKAAVLALLRSAGVDVVGEK